MKQKFVEILEIYEIFNRETAAYRKDAACRKGCAFCCTEAGSIDATTLEGWMIREFIRRMPRSRQTGLKKTLNQEIKKREAGHIVPCPFLMKNQVCMIYDVRPFACRRIYSLNACSKDNLPVLSRTYMELARETVGALQRLDENGYTGHISYILHMLDTPRFLETYRAGEFKPEEIMTFGKTHRIVINKMVLPRPSGKSNKLTEQQ